ncbi:MAG TPA: hypothetical protein VG941_02100 [Candidatus Paceibacterota bacterium]|nr:hypothetical protein [Candidatus Paceibacterota bacterium]
MSRYNRNADYMPENKPGRWESNGKIEGPVTHHNSIAGGHDTADVRDSSGQLHKDVTVIPRDDNERRR